MTRHDDRYVIRCTVQAPHRTRGIFAGQIFKVPETQVRVICDNMGGGFGMKGALYNEYPLTALAAKLLGRPVKWIAERSEGLVSDEQARDNVTDAELALDKNGRFLALRVKTLANIGAYHTSDRAAGPPLVNLGVLAGTYTTPAIHVEVAGVMTHTMLTGHYRGAGRPEAAYVIETMVDLAAQKLGIDRGRAAPAQHHSGERDAVTRPASPITYDSGDFAQESRRRAGPGRLCRLRAPPRRGEAARQAARHRRLQHDRGLERRHARTRRSSASIPAAR